MNCVNMMQDILLQTIISQNMTKTSQLWPTNNCMNSWKNISVQTVNQDLLGQCKARPFKFHRVCLFLLFYFLFLQCSNRLCFRLSRAKTNRQRVLYTMFINADRTIWPACIQIEPCTAVGHPQVHSKGALAPHE